MSDELWNESNKFIPERFIKNGKIFKPEYFLPFGIGRRMCVGYKMVQQLSFSIIANILKDFKIIPIERESYDVPVGNLALPEKTFTFSFMKR